MLGSTRKEDPYESGDDETQGFNLNNYGPGEPSPQGIREPSSRGTRDNDWNLYVAELDERGPTTTDASIRDILNGNVENEEYLFAAENPYETEAADIFKMTAKEIQESLDGLGRTKISWGEEDNFTSTIIDDKQYKATTCREEEDLITVSRIANNAEQNLKYIH